ncbi:hypothetical protein LUZ60_005533 [Juncus effusus]|nr:hypothetical protein LUZ60_005533 [Juncus effusus]
MAMNSLFKVLFFLISIHCLIVMAKQDKNEKPDRHDHYPPPPLSPTPAPAMPGPAAPAPAPAPVSPTTPMVQQLKINFYNKTCPSAESLVSAEMKLIQTEDPTLMPALIRLHFHDCFVRGCDASVLLTSKSGRAEKDAVPNQSLRGFAAVERLKTKLETACHGVVSCADILAIAARDAVFLSNGTHYDVETGRRDGNISIDNDAYTNLPPFKGNITALIALYATKNLTIKDLVVLSGAHSIGVSHCSTLSERLYNYSGTGNTDPTLNQTYAQQLKKQCTANDYTTTVEMDPGNPLTFGLGYFKAVLNHQGLFSADDALLHNNVTLAYLAAQANATSPIQFFLDFAQSMINMGRVDVLTGTNGTIRAVCGSYVD